MCIIGVSLGTLKERNFGPFETTRDAEDTLRMAGWEYKRDLEVWLPPLHVEGDTRAVILPLELPEVFASAAARSFSS